METEILEKIKVLATFENGQLRPVVFQWRNRLYKILRVVFSYSKNIGKEKIFYFSVGTKCGVFELAFNREKFSWELTRIF